jgi:hypothetical protein
VGEQRRGEAGKHENFGRQRYTNLIDKMHHGSLWVGQRLPSFVRLPANFCPDNPFNAGSSIMSTTLS